MAGFEDVIKDLASANRAAAAAGPTKFQQQAAIDQGREYGLAETFKRGAQAGAQGLRTDLNYFAALGNSLIGDEEGVAANIRKARINESFAGDTLGNLETFGEFWDEPTFEGFVSQVFKGTGQLVPFAITSIASAGVGAGLGVGLKLGGEATKYAAKKIIKESLEKTAKGLATPDEKDIAEGAFNLAKRARYGAYAGAGASEFAPLSGSNFAEAIESDMDPNDPMVAFRAAALGVPQAAIGVGGEAMMVKLIASRAKKLAGGNSSSVYGRLAKDLGGGFLKSGATESAAEVAQEGLAVLNRAEMDSTFTAQEAKMRLAESAFAAFFGGGAFGAAGSTAAGGVRELGNINIPDNVSKQARGYLEQGKEAFTEHVINNEFIRRRKSGFSDPEAPSDINAQLELMFKEGHKRDVVWVEGDTPSFGASEKPRKMNLAFPSGNREAYVAFIPGRGTIVSPYMDVIEQVVAGKASEDVLAAAIKMSGTKPPDADRVVQVLNAKGDDVYSEATNAENQSAALAAANEQLPENGTIRVKSTDDIVVERQDKVQSQVLPEGQEVDQRLEDLAQFAEGLEAVTQERKEELQQEAQDLSRAVETPEGVDPDRLDALEQEVQKTQQDSDREAPISDLIAEYDAAISERKGEPKISSMREKTIRERVTDVVERIEAITPREEIVEGNRSVRPSPRLQASSFFTDLTTGETFRGVDVQDPQKIRTSEEIDASRGRAESVQQPMQAGPELRAQARLAEQQEEFGNRLADLAKSEDPEIVEAAKALNKRYQEADADGKNLLIRMVLDKKAALEESLGRGAEDRLTRQDLQDEVEAGQLSEDVEGVEQEVADPTSSMGEQSLRVVFEMNFAQAPVDRDGLIKLYPRDMPSARAAFMEAFEGIFSPNWEDGGYWQRMIPAMLNRLTEQKLAGKEIEIDAPSPLNPGRYLIRVLTSDAELFRHKPRTKKGQKPKPEQLLTLKEFLLAEVKAAKNSKFAKDSGISITDPDGETAAVNLVDIVAAGKRLLETRLQQEFVAASDGQGLMEMFNELIVNGYDIYFDLEGENRAGDKVVKQKSIAKQTTFTAKHIVDEDSMATDLEQQTRTRRGAQSNRSQLELFTLDGKSVGEQTTFKSTILRELAAYQQKVNRWFISNSDVDPNDPTNRIIRDGANKTRPVAPRYLNPILKTAASSKDDPYLKDDEGKAMKIPLRKILSKNLKMSREEDLGRVKRPLSFALVTDANRSYLQDRAERRLGREILEEDLEAELEKELGIQQGLFEREVSGVPGLDEKGEPEGSGSRLLDESPDVPYAFYDVEKPSGVQNRYGVLSFPFGEAAKEGGSLVEAAAVIRRMVGTLGIKKQVGVLFRSQLSGLKRSEIKARFGDARVADVVIEEMEKIAGSETDHGRAITFANAHFVLVDDMRSSNELETALVLAHEVGHVFLNEQLDSLGNKPIYKKLMQAFNKRDRSIKEYDGATGFEEWFADNVAKWAGKEFINAKPKNVVESTFKKIANDLKKAFNAMRAALQKRLGGSVDLQVEAFIDSVAESNFRNNIWLTDAAVVARTFEKKALVRAMAEETANTPGAVRLSKSLFEKARLAVNDQVKGMKTLRHVFFTANKNLRFMGTVGDAIADLFYREAGARTPSGRMGFLQEADVQNREIEERFRKEIGDLDSPEVIAAMETANTDTPTSKLENELAVKIRTFLEDLHKNYIQPAQAGYGRNQKGRIDFQQNYFPIVLNLQEIANNPDSFAQLLLNAEARKKPFASSEDRIKALKAIRKSLARIIKYQDVVVNSDLTIDEANPEQQENLRQQLSEAREEKRRLTALLDRGELAKTDFALPPVEAFMLYKKQLVKRVEWNSSTKDPQGNDRLKPLLAQLSDKDKTYANEIINSFLGYGYEPMSETRLKWQSRLLAAQYTLLLPLAVIGSLPELAGPIIYSKEFNGFEMAWRQIKKGMSQEESRKMAEEIGLVQDGAISNAWISVTEREHMDEASRAWTDKFFKYTGLEFFTNFTRSFSTGMAVQFLLHHADLPNSRSSRYLEQHGVTPAQIKAWDKAGRTFESKEGKAVKYAIQKFVESSILRPNAAERPMWASDPRWALVWQLKAYFYAFYTKIIGGIRRETMIRLGEGEGNQRIYGAAGILALSAVALLPLAMIGMELREYAKTGLAFVGTFGESDKNYFRTDDMEWGAYLGEAFDKAGIYGPLSIASMAYRSGQWNGPAAGLAALLGPTFETVEAVVGRGEFDRIVPAAAIL